MKELKTQYIFEINVFKENFRIAKDYFKTNDIVKLIEMSQNTECDILSLKFNVDKLQDIKTSIFVLKQLLPIISKPLMINGSGNDVIDRELLPKIARNLDRKSIIAQANENTYKEIVPVVVKANHKLVLKTPIDINSCKELSILVNEYGLDHSNIIINPDIGGLGYGFEYGYSIIEKIKCSRDKFLNFPIISFASSESLNVKETKSDNLSKSWGQLDKRSRMFELASVSAVKASGADLIVLYHPESIKIMKGLV